jgi:hypothetical protein
MKKVGIKSLNEEREEELAIVLKALRNKSLIYD